MKHLFYFIAFLPILWEAMVLANPRVVNRFLDNLKAKKGNSEQYTQTEKFFGVLQIGYFIWCFIGLFSSQWVLFLPMVILGVIPKRYHTLRYVDSLISLALLIFIILNAYHFRIDVYSWVISLF